MRWRLGPASGDDCGVKADETDACIESPRPHEERIEFTYVFDDGYWDDAFDTLYDPCMRVCSVFGC